MKTLWPRSRALGSNHGRWWALLVVVFLLLAFWARGFITNLMSPFWRAERQVRIEGEALATAGLARSALVEQNVNLSRQLETLQAARLELAMLKAENQKLRQHLGATIPDLRRKAVAYVLSRERATLHDVIILDIGQDNNPDLLKGDLVLADSQLILGQIVEVFAHQSKVELFSAPDRRLPVSLGISGLAAEAVGLGDGNFQVRLPKGVTVGVGDAVRLSTYNTRFLLGEVREVREDPALPFVAVSFKMPINLNNLQLVEIYEP